MQNKVQYFVKKSAILAMLALTWQTFYCTALHILLNFGDNIGTTWFADGSWRSHWQANAAALPGGPRVLRGSLNVNTKLICIIFTAIVMLNLRSAPGRGSER